MPVRTLFVVFAISCGGAGRCADRLLCVDLVAFSPSSTPARLRYGPTYHHACCSIAAETTEDPRPARPSPRSSSSSGDSLSSSNSPMLARTSSSLARTSGTRSAGGSGGARERAGWRGPGRGEGPVGAVDTGQGERQGGVTLGLQPADPPHLSPSRLPRRSVLPARLGLCAPPVDHLPPCRRR